MREGSRALKVNRTELAAIVDDLAPGLTDRRGIGPVSAAQVIISFSSPLPASSGRTTRHRLM